MTDINQLLDLIDMSGLRGDTQILLRLSTRSGEFIVPMESCTFHEIGGKTALMFNGSQQQLETVDRQIPKTNEEVLSSLQCRKCLRIVNNFSMSEVQGWEFDTLNGWRCPKCASTETGDR